MEPLAHAWHEVEAWKWQASSPLLIMDVHNTTASHSQNREGLATKSVHGKRDMQRQFQNGKSFMPESGCGRVGGGNLLLEEGNNSSLDPRSSGRQKDVGKTCPPWWRREGGAVGLTAHL